MDEIRIFDIQLNSVFTSSQQSISDILFMSPICLVDSLFVLLALTCTCMVLTPFKQSTIGTRNPAFPVAGLRLHAWNRLVCQQTLRRHRHDRCRPTVKDRKLIFETIISTSRPFIIFLFSGPRSDVLIRPL